MRKFYKDVSLFLVIFAVCLQILSFDFALARAGGGGSGGGSVGAAGAVVAGIYFAIIQIRRKKLMKKAKEDIEKAKSSDTSWNEEEFKKIVEEVFIKYQNAWSDKDLYSVSSLLTRSYYDKADADIKKTLEGKKNILKEISLLEQNLMSVKDVSGQNGDMFVMEINATMIDYTINESTGLFLESNLTKKDGEGNASYMKRAQIEPEFFQEYWVFMRLDSKWLLYDIKQTNAIIKDIKGLSESELKNILKKEENSSEVSDANFYS